MEDFDKDILDTFLGVDTTRQLALALGVSYKNLAYNIYKVPDEKKYRVFEVKKRNGKTRQISAPISGVKYFQKNLSIILNHLHNPKYCVHGYVKDKSIKTNAQIHVKKRIVINIDLKDFFPSINFGRIRGLFKGYPFNFNDEVATILAQICCYESCLPQGAPSSPVLSNYICYRLDNQILNLCRKCKVAYTRYADDITFSTNLKELPAKIGIIKNNTLTLSDNLVTIIESNGFTINKEKIRYALKNNRQEVTGLIVNSHVNVNRKYVRHVRAILHSWEKYGIEEASREHFEKYNYKNKIENDIYSFIKEISGKIGYIGHIKGRNNSVYRSLYQRITKLDSEIRLPIPERSNTNPEIPIIFCEGKTDAIHLKKALSYFNKMGQFIDLNIQFYEYRDEIKMTNSKLLQVCETRPDTKRSRQMEIYLFDRDDKRFNNKVSKSPQLYKYWNNNVYSALLPIPDHRDFDEICIEHFYTDEDIKIKDSKQRRLFLSTEFNSETGFHEEEDFTFNNRVYLKAPYPRIIDSRVSKRNGDNAALSKNAFAKNIAEEKDDFKNVSFENFGVIFQLLSKIIEESRIYN